ncbi:MAG: PilZ domain-containing protein [Sphingomicrobium sp.]
MEEIPAETTLYSLSDGPPAPGDRRESDRQLTLFRVGSMIIGERRELCLIKNISSGGMLIRAYCTIEPGTSLSIELKCGESVDGIARWVEGDTVGVAFNEPVDVVELLATSMEGPRPRMPRIEVDCVIWVRDGADVHRVAVCDVSQGGTKIETPIALQIGSDVMVTLPGLSPVPSVVRWSALGCFGLTFNKVLPLPLLIVGFRSSASVSAPPADQAEDYSPRTSRPGVQAQISARRISSAVSFWTASPGRR